MPAINLTIEQLVETFNQLAPEEMKLVEERLRQQRTNESEEKARHDFVAAAIEATDWWDAEGDQEWDKWRP